MSRARQGWKFPEPVEADHEDVTEPPATTDDETDEETADRTL